MAVTFTAIQPWAAAMRERYKSSAVFPVPRARVDGGEIRIARPVIEGLGHLLDDLPTAGEQLGNAPERGGEGVFRAHRASLLLHF